MNEERVLIRDTTDRILNDLCSKELVDRAEQGQWPQELWQALEDNGLTLAGLPEESGGAGGRLGDSMEVMRRAARVAAPLPLAETFMAGCMLVAAGCEVPKGVLTIAAVENPLLLSKTSTGYEMEGEARVAFLGQAIQVVVLAELAGDLKLVTISPSDCISTAHQNLAGECRDHMVVESLQLTDDQLYSLEDSWNEDHLLQLGALTRAVMMAGALDSILEMSVHYALERQQFGRPIAKFQAIQQQLAVLAGEVAAAGKAADVAVQAAESGNAETAIALAKSRVGEAAGIGAEIAHQVHGAMGFTHEHSLHHRTRRLWSWRDEYGSESYWQARLGRAIAVRGADDFWPFITQS